MQGLRVRMADEWVEQPIFGGDTHFKWSVCIYSVFYSWWPLQSISQYFLCKFGTLTTPYFVLSFSQLARCMYCSERYCYNHLQLMVNKTKMNIDLYFLNSTINNTIVCPHKGGNIYRRKVRGERNSNLETQCCFWMHTDCICCRLLWHLWWLYSCHLPQPPKRCFFKVDSSSR